MKQALRHAHANAFRGHLTWLDLKARLDSNFGTLYNDLTIFIISPESKIRHSWRSWHSRPITEPNWSAETTDHCGYVPYAYAINVLLSSIHREQELTVNQICGSWTIYPVGRPLNSAFWLTKLLLYLCLITVTGQTLVTRLYTRKFLKVEARFFSWLLLLSKVPSPLMHI